MTFALGFAFGVVFTIGFAFGLFKASMFFLRILAG
jgi:hypothetical protein